MSQFSLTTVKNLAKFNLITDERRKIINKVILFTNARDEKNIKEWTAHHLLLGFDFIYIFDHKSQIPLKSVFANFDKRVVVERCEMANKVKLPLMNKAAQIAKQADADWMIYLDADEFIILNAFKNVKQLLYTYRGADQLAVNWVAFGSNHHKQDPEGLMLESYTRSDPTLHTHIKSFVRPSQIKSATSPHFYNIMNPGRDVTITNRIKHQGSPFNECNLEFGKAFAYIAHYAIQSEETYKKRKVDLPTDHTAEYRGNFDPVGIHQIHNSTENLLPKNRYAARVRNFLAHYDPTIAKTDAGEVQQLTTA
jgi:hypothetical protein